MFLDGLSDRGYCSMNHVDGIKSSPAVDNLDGEECKREESESSDLKNNEDNALEKQNGLCIFSVTTFFKILFFQCFNNLITFLNICIKFLVLPF